MAEEQTMLSYNFDEKDAAAYYEDFETNRELRKQFRASPFRTLLYYVYLAGIPGLVFLSVNAMTGNFWIAFFAMSVFAALWQHLFRFFVKYLSVRRLKRHRGLLGKQQVQITEQGFSVQNSMMQWTLFWPHIEDIVVADHHIMMINSKESGRGVFPIPLRIFHSKADVKSFLNQVAVYWKQGAIANRSDMVQED